MKPNQMPPESHKSEHIAWLRAAILGANDGIVSTASLIVGVAAAHATHQNILVAGVAGLVAGAMSMAFTVVAFDRMQSRALSYCF